jgi:hypothetical protein
MRGANRLDLALDEAQIIDLTRILVDEDADGALTWMQRCSSGKSRHAPAKLDIVLRDYVASVFSNIMEKNAAGEALLFLHDHLEEELKRSRNPHCVPVFESCYKPNQADSYLTDAGSG